MAKQEESEPKSRRRINDPTASLSHDQGQRRLDYNRFLPDKHMREVSPPRYRERPTTPKIRGRLRKNDGPWRLQRYSRDYGRDRVVIQMILKHIPKYLIENQMPWNTFLCISGLCPRDEGGRRDISETSTCLSCEKLCFCLQSFTHHS